MKEKLKIDSLLQKMKYAKELYDKGEECSDFGSASMCYSKSFRILENAVYDFMSPVPEINGSKVDKVAGSVERAKDAIRVAEGINKTALELADNGEPLEAYLVCNDSYLILEGALFTLLRGIEYDD